MRLKHLIRSRSKQARADRASGRSTWTNCQAALGKYMPDAEGGTRSVEKFPRIGSIEVLDQYGFQQRWLEIPQIYSMAGTGRRLERLPMRHDAARLAAHIPQGSIAPDVAFRVPRMAFDRHRSKRVIGPYSSRAPAQRTVATRGFKGRCRQRQVHCPAMAGAVQRWRWLFVIHGDVSLAAIRGKPRHLAGQARPWECLLRGSDLAPDT